MGWWGEEKSRGEVREIVRGEGRWSVDGCRTLQVVEGTLPFTLSKMTLKCFERRARSNFCFKRISVTLVLKINEI